MNALNEINRTREAYRKALQDLYVEIPKLLAALGEKVQPPTAVAPPPKTAPAAAQGRKKWVRAIDPTAIAAVLPQVRAALTNDWVSTRELAKTLAADPAAVRGACENLLGENWAEHQPNGAHPKYRRSKQDDPYA